jgi:hypothetical protein
MSGPTARRPADVATPTPLTAADIAPSSNPVPLTSAPGARVLDFDAVRAPVPTESPSTTQASSPRRALDLREPSQHSASRTSSAQADPVRRTRFVDGLPALQSLLQAAVAESRERHPPSTVDEAPAALASLPPPPAPMSLVAAPPLRALPALDAVAEDMLVDRLCDRLQERLREQALRQFGFTGGLT